jgi:hypothetical protein
MPDSVRMASARGLISSREGTLDRVMSTTGRLAKFGLHFVEWNGRPVQVTAMLSPCDLEHCDALDFAEHVNATSAVVEFRGARAGVRCHCLRGFPASR